MKTELELARERRERAMRRDSNGELTRHLYRYYKEQLNAPQVASLEQLRELKREVGGGAAA
jgi:hypothetical protein